MQVTKFVDGGKLFLRAFLLDSSKNVNGWRVAQASIPQNIRSFIGLPLLLYRSTGAEKDKPRKPGELDHPPYLFDHSLPYNLEWQERYKIGEIIDVVQKDGRWDAIIEITDPLAKQTIENNDLEFYVSPRVIHDPNDPDDAIKNWIGGHLATVNEPAFGDKAAVKGACYGMAEQCMIALKQASVQQDCGFCVKTELLKLVTSDSSLNSSFLPSAENLPLRMAETVEAKPPGESSECEAKVQALQAELAAIKAIAEQGAQQAQKAADARIAAIEESYRKDKIKVLVTSKISDAKKAEEVYKNFVDAKLTPEVVEKTLAYIPQETAKRDNTEMFTGKPADASSERAGSYARAQAYMNGIIRGASY